MPNKISGLILILASLATACMTDVSTEAADHGAAGGGSVGVDKEALTHTVTLNSWMGITTESQVKQGLHCFTLAFPTLNNQVGQPTCSDIANTTPTARCIVTAGPSNGKEMRVTMSSGSPATGTLLKSGISTGITMRYNVTSSWPKTYVFQQGTTQYVCNVACVPPSCAGVQPTWTFDVPK
jgi:hypothetical protein